MMLNTQINDSVLKSYEELRLNKGDFKEHKFLVLKMTETTIEVDQELTQLSSLEDLTSQLPKNQSRFICYNLSFEMPSQTSSLKEGQRSKMIFITWCPNETKVKEKFQVAATVKTLKSKLNGNSVSVHASSRSDIEEQSMIEKCLLFMK